MLPQAENLNGATIILHALIDGLRVTDRTLNETCMSALRAIGPRVISALSAAANETTNARHRRRIIETIELIEDLGQLHEHAGKSVWKALQEALRVDDAQLNRKAIDAFSCFPENAVFELIVQATYYRRRIGYAERLNQAAMRLGLRRSEDSRNLAQIQ